MSSPLEREAEVFHTAREKGPGPERDQYLTEACGEDLALRQRMEQMLLLYANDSSFLSTCVGDEFELTASAFSLEKPGDRIGPYELKEELGRGGMGVVFLAEQLHPIRRSVALKVIKPGMDSRQIVSRFDAERQALAVMDHANIARVYDAGTTPAGRSYFVMELIAGDSITRYCDHRRLGTDDRLRLFQSVCDAVQHAHQKGVIHRDIKPNNVLVTESDGKPLVKVIDFGVAKALHEGDSRESVYTAHGQLLGTLEYMSPEQASASPRGIDTRTDVYGLGVLLYELLTGVTPFEAKRLRLAEFNEVRRIICEEEPVRPSDRVRQSDTASSVAESRSTLPSHLHRTLTHDLDWVVMKAIEKEPERRYDSVSGLASDISRYLKHEPVSATPPSWGYRLRKLYQRNRLATAAALAISFALITGTAVAAWQAVRAFTAEQAANAARRHSEKHLDAALATMGQLLTHVNNPAFAEVPGMQETRLQILEETLTFFEEFSEQAGTTPELTFRAATTFHALARLARDLGNPDKAISVFEKGITRAEALIKVGDTKYHELHAVLLRDLGWLYMNRAASPQATALANRHLDVAAASFHSLAAKHPEQSRFVTQECETLVRLAELDSRGVRLSQRYKDLVTQITSLYPKCDPSFRIMGFLANYRADQWLDGAEPLYRQACQLARETATPLRENQYERSVIYGAAAQHLADRAPVEAEPLFIDSIALLQELVRKFPDIPAYVNQLVLTAAAFADRLEAWDRHQEAVALVDRLAGAFPAVEGVHDLRATALARHVLPTSPQYYVSRYVIPPALGSQREEFGQVIRVLTEEGAKFPDVKAYFRMRREAYVKNGEWDLALADLNRTDHSSPLTASFLANRSTIWVRKGEFNKAVADLTSIETITKRPDLLEKRAVAHFMAGEFEDSIVDLKNAAVLNELSIPVFFEFPPALAAKSNNAQFREQYRQITFDVNTRMSDFARRYNRADVFAEFGDWGSALEELSADYSKEMSGRYELRRALLELKVNGEDAYRKRCERLVADQIPYRRSVTSDSTLTYWRLCAFPFSVDSFDRAVRTCRLWHIEHPDNCTITEMYASLLYRAGRYQEASVEFAAADRIRHRTVMVHYEDRYYLRAMNCARLGEAEQAQRFLKLANDEADDEDPLKPDTCFKKQIRGYLKAEATAVVNDPATRQELPRSPPPTFWWFQEVLGAAADGDSTAYGALCSQMMLRYPDIAMCDDPYPLLWALTLVKLDSIDELRITALLDKCVQVPAVNATQFIALAAASCRLERFQDAIKYLQRASGLGDAHRLNGVTELYLAFAYSGADRLPEAADLFKRALTIEKEDGAAAEWTQRALFQLLKPKVTRLLAAPRDPSAAPDMGRRTRLTEGVIVDDEHASHR